MTIYEPPFIVGGTLENRRLTEAPITAFKIGKVLLMSDRKEHVQAYGLLFSDSRDADILRSVEELHMVLALQKLRPAPAYDLPLGGGVVHFHHRSNLIELVSSSTHFGKVPDSILEEALKFPNYRLQGIGDERAILGNIELRQGDWETVREWYGERGVKAEDPLWAHTTR
jgi:hypothetical protein